MIMNYIFALIFFAVSLSATAQSLVGDDYTIVFEQEASGNVMIFKGDDDPLTSKCDKSRGTLFNITYSDPDNWDLEKRRALEYGIRLWEEKIETCFPPINVTVTLNNNPASSSLCSTTVYTIDSIFETNYRATITRAGLKYWYATCPEYISCIPTHKDSIAILKETCDFAITFNEAASFYWGLDGETPEDKYDFVTLVIRETAKGLGIKSNIRNQRNRGYTFSSNGRRSHFDLLMGLTAEPFSDNLATQATSGNRQIGSAVFYAPTTFENNISFNYLTEENALASDGYLIPHLPMGFSDHKITAKITDIFPQIGWMKPILTGGDATSSSSSGHNDTIGYFSDTNILPLLTPNMTTVSMLNDENEIAPRSFNSIYATNINYNKELYTGAYVIDLLRNDGVYCFINVVSSGAPNVTISPYQIPDSTDWARSSDGFLRARVACYYPDGAGISANYYHLLLDYTPATPKVEAKTQIASYPYSRSFDFPELTLMFDALGAESINIYHESEDCIESIDINAETSSLYLPNVDPYIENTFTITAYNKNGQKIGNTITWGGEEFMEQFENTYSLSQQLTDDAISLNLVNQTSGSPANRDIVNFSITNLTSPLIETTGIGDGSNVSIPIGNMPKGLYAVKVTDNHGKVYYAKFVKQ